METETALLSANSEPSSPASSTSPPPSSSDGGKTYDVFLNFRGEDTRKTLMGHLKAALKLKGIEIFIDDDEIEKGRYISSQLLEAIEDSSCSIIIFSENYASSTWCLDELVKILDCMKNKGQVVIPIFYHVDPSDVRKQTGNFGVAFTKHEAILREEIERVQCWRDALRKVAGVAGLDLRNYRDEASLIRDIVEEVSRKVPTLVSSAKIPKKHYHPFLVTLYSYSSFTFFMVLLFLFCLFVILPLIYLFAITVVYVMTRVLRVLAPFLRRR